MGSLSLQGPSKVKRGRKATFKITVRNTGDAAVSGVTVRANGRGVKGLRRPGTIAPSKSKTVRITFRFKKTGKLRLKFKATSKNAGSKSASRVIRVVR